MKISERFRLTVTTTCTTTTLAGTGTAGYTGDNGAATSATVALPGAATYAARGNLFECDAKWLTSNFAMTLPIPSQIVQNRQHLQFEMALVGLALFVFPLGMIGRRRRLAKRLAGILSVLLLSVGAVGGLSG